MFGIIKVKRKLAESIISMIKEQQLKYKEKQMYLHKRENILGAKLYQSKINALSDLIIEIENNYINN